MALDFSFYTISAVLGKIFVLMLIGYALYAVKLMDDKFTDQLSLLLVRVIFPALIVSKIVAHFSFAEQPDWWHMPLWAMAFSLAGMAFGAVILKFFKGFAPPERNSERREATAVRPWSFTSGKEFMLSCGFQNCGYLAMNLILFAFSGVISDRLLIYLFLYVLGFDLIVWSLVPMYLSGTLKRDFSMRAFLSPPVIATVSSLLWVLIFGKGNMPLIVLDPLKQLGQAAFPLAIIILGAYLARYKAYNPSFKRALVSCISVKLFLVPSAVLFLVKYAPMEYDYKFFLFMESTLPTAVALIIIGSYTASDNKFLGSVIFYSHLLSVITIPLWLAVFKMFVM